MSYEARIRRATRATVVAGCVYIAVVLFVGRGTLTYVVSVLCLASAAGQVAARVSFLRYQIADLQRQVRNLAARVYARPVDNTPPAE